MSADLAARIREAVATPCDARGGFGSRLRRMQALLREALPAVEGGDICGQREVVAALRKKCGGRGKPREFSREHIIPESTISEVLTGKKDVPESIANALGFARVHMFRKMTKQGSNAHG